MLPMVIEQQDEQHAFFSLSRTIFIRHDSGAGSDPIGGGSHTDRQCWGFYLFSDSGLGMYDVCACGIGTSMFRSTAGWVRSRTGGTRRDLGARKSVRFGAQIVDIESMGFG